MAGRNRTPLPTHKVGNKVMTPRPLLLCTHLSALQEELQQGAAAGGLWPPWGAAKHAGAWGGGRVKGPAATAGAALLPGSQLRGHRGGKGEGGAPTWWRESSTPLSCLPGRARQRRLWFPQCSGGGARAAPGGCGRGARRMCCLTLRGPRGSRSSGSQHFLSLPEPDTDSSPEHRLRGSPRPWPTPSTPRAPPVGASSASPLPHPVSPGGGGAGQRLEASRGPAEVNRSIPLQSTGFTPKLQQTEELHRFGSSC